MCFVLSGPTCLSSASDWCSACYNGGSCLETRFGVMCQCPRFWTGPQCKDPITCRDLPCKQASACHDYVSWKIAPSFLHAHLARLINRVERISMWPRCFVCYVATCSLEAIIAPASQDGQALSVPSTRMSASLTPVATVASVLISKIATTVSAFRDILVTI